MAEFIFYGSWEDSLTILNQLVMTNKFTFIIDKWYEEPNAISLRYFDENGINILESTPHLFLLSDKFSIFPPYFSGPTNNLWSIFPLRSGPFLNLDLPKTDTHAERKILGKGWLIYQLKYWHPETLEYYSPPQTLKDAFKLVKKIIYQHCERRFIPFHGFTAEGKEIHRVRTLYIGKYGMELVRRGDAYVYVGRNGYLTDKDLAKNRQDVDLSEE